MPRSPIALAELLDGWSAEGRAALTETAVLVVANGLNAADVTRLVTLSAELGWSFELEDGTESVVEAREIHADYQPYRMVLSKPNAYVGDGRVITMSGLRHLLLSVPPPVIEALRCSVAFETRSVRVCPPGDGTPFTPEPTTANPRKVVRESGERRLVTDDPGRWLLRDPAAAPRNDPIFRTWASLAEPTLAMALANEIDSGSLVFRGPPMVRLEMPPSGAEFRLGEEGGLALQRAAAWVYENERELEMRHGLYSAEIARTAAFGQAAASLFDRAVEPALESARIAYGLNLSAVSRDSLKALADLRKAIADETARLAESTRTVSTAVVAAVFAGVGLVVARAASAASTQVVGFLVLVLALYVASVIWSGFRFIEVQRDIRRQWRFRLYAFLTEAEYEAMVERPAASAEGAFRLTARFGGAIVLLLVAAVAASIIFAKPSAVLDRGSDARTAKMTSPIQKDEKQAAPDKPATPPTVKSPSP